MSGESAKFQTLMSQGHSSVWEQDWNKAVEFYRQALEEVPDHPMALSSLALVYYQIKKYDEALRMYQRVSAINPNDPMPFEKIGAIYERVGMILDAVRSYMQGAEMQLKSHDVDRAIENFHHATRLDPENQTIHTRLAMIYDKMGRKENAANEYLITASLMQQNGEISKALQIVQYTLTLNPDNETAKKARSLLKENKPLPKYEQNIATAKDLSDESENEEAAEPVQLYDPITEARLYALKQMAGLLFDQNEEARQVNRRGVYALTRGTGGLSPEQAERTRIQLHLSQTIDLQTSGQDEAAAIELESAIELGLNQSASFFVLGLLVRTRDPQKGLKYLQKSVKNPNYELGSYLLIGEIYDHMNQYKEASNAALQALKLADAESVPPEQADELIQLYEPIFESQTQVNDEKDLRNLYQVIIRQLIRPDWREYLKDARKQLPPQPEGSPPLPLAEMLLETNSGHVVEALTTIRQLAAEGKLRTAMEEAYHALTFAPTYLPLHVQMGELLISEGRVMEAIEKFMLVASLYNVRGESTQAIRLLERVTKLAPMDMSVRTMLIEMLKSSGRLDDAIQQIMDLANVYYLLAELEKARQTYESALTLSQQSGSTRRWAVQILNKLADIELQSLDWKSAITIFEQIRSIQPLDSTPRATLIDLHFRMAQNEAAMSELESYLRLLENNNRYEQAIHFMDQLLADRPENGMLQKRMIALCTSHNEQTKAVEKMDGLAEKLMAEGNIPAVLSTLQLIIGLNPSNTGDYQKLYEQLKPQGK